MFQEIGNDKISFLIHYLKVNFLKNSKVAHLVRLVGGLHIR